MIKKIIIVTISFYRKNISPIKPGKCVFYPTCSQYAIEATKKYGPLKGLYLTIKRILSCHPWQKNNFDPLK